MKKIYEWWCKAEKVVCGVGFMFLILFVFMSAIFRFFKYSMSWYIDLSMLLLAWTAFLGADMAWRSGQIIGVDILTRKFSAILQNILKLLVDTIILVSLIVIVIYGIRLAWVNRIATYQSMPIPYSLVTLSLVLAAFSMIFTTIQKIKKVILTMRGKSTATIQDTNSMADLDEHLTKEGASK
ncbi:MAG: TRAP transporter small permease [Spirochaetales bacterium]|nr:TRAP transporter small permease [Spirochaetales bacterium]